MLLTSAEMRACGYPVFFAFLIACGAAEPSPKPVPATVSDSPAATGKIDAGPAPPEPVASCTITKALSESCAPCVKAACCSPPVKFAVNTAQALGCRIGCRKPLPPGAPNLEPADRAAIVKTCLAKCGEHFADSEEATRLDACIAQRCESQCLTNR
jgi:hypothetical protein